MSAGVGSIQEQVESVLGALVKVATAELTKLFESRYRASAVDVSAGRTEDNNKNGTLHSPDSLSSEETKRSIGVQVDGDSCPPLELTGNVMSFK